MLIPWAHRMLVVGRPGRGIRICSWESFLVLFSIARCGEEVEINGSVMGREYLSKLRKYIEKKPPLEKKNNRTNYPQKKQADKFHLYFSSWGI